MLKRQWFDDSENKKTVSKKCQHFNKHDNEKMQDLNKNETEVEGNRYIFFSFLILFLFFQKELNNLSDLSKKIKNPTHLIYISKNY